MRRFFSRLKVLTIVTVITLVWAAVWLIGNCILQYTELLFRTWVPVTGEMALLLVLPFLGTVWIIAVMRIKQVKQGIATAVGVLLVILYLIWSFFAFLGIVLSTDSEEQVSSRLIVVAHSYGYDETEYRYYRPVGAFLMEPGEVDMQDKLDYLTDTYDRSFRVVNGEIYDEEFSSYPITVSLDGADFRDNLTACIIAECAQEGMKELGLSRGYRMETNHVLYYSLENEDDIQALAEELYALITYICERTDYFDTRQGYIYLEHTVNDYEVDIAVPFGLQTYGSAQELETYIRKEYEQDVAYYSMLTPIEETFPNIEQEETETTVAQVDPLETYALQIYEAVLAEQGYGCEVCLNAKGVPYLELGSSDAEDGGTDRFTLVYDRTSQNGNCELYVLYREHYTETGEQGNTAILDMYAIETATGEVVSSGRKAWSDVGSAAYRELTGE